MGVGEMGADIAVSMLVVMSSSVTLRIFEVFAEVGPSGQNDSWTATLMKNGNATPMSCTIPSSSVHRCDSRTPVSFVAGDTIFVKIVPTGAPPATPFHWRALTTAP
jgi:hypothetical protein